MSQESSLKRRRLRQLLQECAAELKRFANPGFSRGSGPRARLPSANVVYETLHLLIEEGLLAASKVLEAQYKAIVNQWFDIIICEHARGASKKYQNWLKKRFGLFPKPMSGDGEHYRRQEGRIVKLLGASTTMQNHIEGLKGLLSEEPDGGRDGGRGGDDDAGKPYYPPSWFLKHNVSSDRLRQAFRRSDMRRGKVGKRYHYSQQDGHHLWPQLVASPEKRETS